MNIDWNVRMFFAEKLKARNMVKVPVGQNNGNWSQSCELKACRKLFRVAGKFAGRRINDETLSVPDRNNISIYLKYGSILNFV